MGYLSFFAVVFLFSMLMVGQGLYLEDQKTNTTRDIYNYTAALDLNTQNVSCTQITWQDRASLKENRLIKITCAFRDFVLVSGVESMKFGIEYGYEHPEYDLQAFLSLGKLLLIGYILSLFLPLVVPFIALMYIAFDWVRQWRSR